MMQQWQDFLSAHGARAGSAGESVKTEPWGGAGCRLFDLSHLGLIAVRGPDARSYLQGQLTNDVRVLSSSRSQISAHCSQKGRMLAVFRLFAIADNIYLQLPAERLPDLVKRLGIFILRAKVTVTDASEELVRIGLAGADAAALLTQQGLEPPAETDAQTTTGDLAVIRLPGATPRFEILGPLDAMTALWEQLADQAPPASAGDWTLLDIQAGLPNVYTQTVETFVPQMTNLHLIQGVSFNKGCYTGQEVVARSHFLGKLKRRMYLSEVETATPPRPGDALYSPASTSQQTTGWVVDAAPLAPGRYALLVVSEVSAAEAGDVHLSEHGPKMDLTPPPYGFALEEAAETSGAD